MLAPSTNGHAANAAPPNFLTLLANAGHRELDQIVERIAECEAEIESLRVFEKALRKKCEPKEAAKPTGEKLGETIAEYVRSHGPSEAAAIAREAGRKNGVVVATAKRDRRFTVTDGRIALKRTGAK